MNLLKVKAWAGGDGEAFINLCAAVVFPFVPKLGFTAASEKRLVDEEYLRSPLTLFSKMTSLYTLHFFLLTPSAGLYLTAVSTGTALLNPAGLHKAKNQDSLHICV